MQVLVEKSKIVIQIINKGYIGKCLRRIEIVLNYRKTINHKISSRVE